MSDWTAEKFTQRLVDLGLINPRQMEQVCSNAGTGDVSVDDIISVVQRSELLTNLQVDRVLRGERMGFFYGKYKVQYLIGTGTFARVYRAVHVETGEVRAVKVLRKRYRESLAEVEQFLREGKMGAQLRHVNVVPIYEVDGDPRAPFMVMEFVEGQNLRDLIRIRKKFDPLATVKIITDVAAGLAFAAEKGITHRDLKMSNVLVASNGRSKLVDFGLAAASNLKNEEELADCPNARAIDYAALERGTGVRKDDIRSDVFFTGCIMYNCLTGHAPLYETKDRLQRLSFSRFRDIKSVTEWEPNLPLPVLQFLHRAMELDPTKRFANPAEMHAEIKTTARRLEEGDAPAGNGNGDGANGLALAKKTAAEQEGAGHKVLLVESQAALQDAIRNQLKKRGYRVLIMSNPDSVFSRFDDDPAVADVVIFSTSGLEERAVDAFNRFGEEELTKDLPAILLIDDSNPSLVRRARPGPHRIRLPLPLKVKNLRTALLKLLANRSKADAS